MDENKLRGSEMRERMAAALLEFVERVTKGGATPEELEALPGVARVLSEIPILN